MAPVGQMAAQAPQPAQISLETATQSFPDGVMAPVGHRSRHRVQPVFLLRLWAQSPWSKFTKRGLSKVPTNSPAAATARATAAEELGFAESLCDQPPGTVFALHRSHDESGAVREAFRTLHRRETPHRDFGALPVFAISQVEEDAPQEAPDLAALVKARK